MQKYDVHFCLISDQAAPNLLPILDEELKPKEAVFIVTQRMKQKAEFLVETFKKKGVKATIKELKDEFNFGLMEEEIFQLAEAYLDQNVALNVTGATKLISIAAEHAFSAAGKPIFYVDTDEKRIVYISKDENGNWMQDKVLNTNTDLDIYLSSYGASILKKSNPDSRVNYLKCVESWIKNYDKVGKLIPLLNLLATKSKDRGYKTTFAEAKCKKIGELDQFLLDLHHQKMLDYDGNEINFINQSHQVFLNGGWLEDYTYQQIKDIKQIDDIACGIDVANSRYQKGKNEFSKENQGNKNEFDIAFMANNRFHIIECKTQLMNKSGGIKAEDILYKLETLKDYGGFMTKKCLVTYFEVPESVRNRAKTLNIELIEGSAGISQIKAKVQNWIGNKKR